MPSTIGTTLRVTVFGQSHSPAIGCVIEGLPAGFAVDQDALAAFLARRAPGTTPWSTPRKEADAARIVSGLNPEGQTCGAPVAAIIENTNTRSKDYSEIKRKPRPGHADYTAWAKWGEAHDIAGGGHFSGRLTAPLCVAGGIALQVLGAKGVRIAAHLSEVAGIADEAFSDDPTMLERQLARLADAPQLPVIDAAAGERMVEAIMAAKADGDSVGGVVECVALGLPAGIGSPMFDGIENTMARILFGIPAVKGVEFGAGFGLSRMRGSEANDAFRMVGGAVAPATNNMGGILGGITTGAPVVVRAGIKPTPSIGIEQDTVDLLEGADATLAITGRHDPCIAPRAVPVVEAACALALLDSWLSWPAESFI